MSLSEICVTGMHCQPSLLKFGCDGTSDYPVTDNLAQNGFYLPSASSLKEEEIKIEKVLLNGEILEDYPDTGRGETSLVLGFSDDIPIHVVCGWRGQKLSLITVYVPKHTCGNLPKLRNGLL